MNTFKINVMKRIYLFLVLVTGLLLIHSCNDEFMDRVPENSVNDGALWKSPIDLQLYVNNLYSRSDLLLRDEGGGGSCNIGIYTLDRDNGSDTEIPRDHNTHMNGQTIIPTTEGWAPSDWRALRDINYFFAHYQNATGDAAEINKYVGEALVFRALFYFNKLKRFGNVPWYDNLLNSDDEILYKPRDSRKFVVEKLMEDLDNAVSYLPIKGTWNGRLNKEAAMILQARIALYEGTWEKYHAGTVFGVEGSNGSDFIKKAADVTDALIALNSCELDNVGATDGYWKLFNQKSYASSKEVVFWRQYNFSLGFGHGWGKYSAYGALTGLSKTMVDSYLCTDGKPANESALYQGDDNLLTLVADRDPRLNQTIYVNDNKHIQFSEADRNDMFIYPAFDVNDKLCVTGYQLYKGHLPTTGANMASNNHEAAMIYFRYGEALLINAEAKAELGTITQADLDKTVNKLRARVGMPSMSITAVNAFTYPDGKEFPALSNLINEIRRERKVELAAEGFRVDDIFRWAAAGTLIKGYLPKGARLSQWEGTLNPTPSANFVAAVGALEVDANGYISPYAKQDPVKNSGYNFNLNRDYLRPLPTEALRINPDLKPQNPGWE
jgi:hypothetical protein